MLLSLPNHYRVSFLQNLVYCDKRFIGLDFVGEDRLARGCRGGSASIRGRGGFIPTATYTFIPAQKAAEDLWSHVYTMQLRTCLPADDHVNQGRQFTAVRIASTEWEREGRAKNRGASIRLGAVSSGISIRSVTMIAVVNGPCVGTQLTDASSFANVNRQIGLRSVRDRSVISS